MITGAGVVSFRVSVSRDLCQLFQGLVSDRAFFGFCMTPERYKSLIPKRMVGASGFEPPASWSRTRRASQAALRPEILKTTANSLSRITTHRNQSYCAVLPAQGIHALDNSSRRVRIANKTALEK